MNIDEKIVRLIDDFVERNHKILYKKNRVLINSIEIYYKSHTFLDVLMVMEINQKTIMLKNKLTLITEAVLELDK